MSTENPELSERHIDLIGIGGAVVSFVAFALVGEVALESLTYGVVAGLFAALGSSLFLPWFLRFQTVTDDSEDELDLAEIASRVPKSSQLGVLGLGLEMGSIVMLAVGLALDGADFVLGGGAAVLVTLLVYLLGSLLLDR